MVKATSSEAFFNHYKALWILNIIILRYYYFAHLQKFLATHSLSHTLSGSKINGSPPVQLQKSRVFITECILKPFLSTSLRYKWKYAQIFSVCFLSIFSVCRAKRVSISRTTTGNNKSFCLLTQFLGFSNNLKLKYWETNSSSSRQHSLYWNSYTVNVVIMKCVVVMRWPTQ